MPEQKNSKNNKIIQPGTDNMNEEIPSLNNNTLAIQNNNYFTQQIDLIALGKLTAKDPALAKMYMAIQTEQFEHSKSVDNRILTIEEREQEGRLSEIPNKKIYAFRAQMGSISIVLSSFITSICFGVLGMENAAIASIVTGAGIVAVNFLGIKNKGQR